jgi:hypothetical protein
MKIIILVLLLLILVYLLNQSEYGCFVPVSVFDSQQYNNRTYNIEDIEPVIIKKI